MNSTRRITRNNDRKVILSTLWIFAMFNYLYADVITFMDPVSLRQITSGYVGAIRISHGFLLGAAILMETAIVMVLLSRILNYTANRWANITAGVIHTAAVFSSMFVGEPPASYYLFHGTIEIACTMFIIWYAWSWPGPEKNIEPVID